LTQQIAELTEQHAGDSGGNYRRRCDAAKREEEARSDAQSRKFHCGNPRKGRLFDALLR
jgi:hypothetical protein